MHINYKKLNDKVIWAKWAKANDKVICTFTLAYYDNYSS